VKKHPTKAAIMIISSLTLGVIVVGPSAREANAACPIGSYPWVDNWGTQVCKSFSSGQNTVTQGSLSHCPAGSHPWVDEWGTSVCQSFNEGKRYYDTSKGCPTGTYSWVDNWGNKICKAF
jgi:hypothetical protein